MQAKPLTPSVLGALIAHLIGHLIENRPDSTKCAIKWSETGPLGQALTRVCPNKGILDSLVAHFVPHFIEFDPFFNKVWDEVWDKEPETRFLGQILD